MARPRKHNAAHAFAARWNVKVKTAYKLCKLPLGDEAMAVMVADSQRLAALRSKKVAPRGKYVGGMKALGMRRGQPGILAGPFLHASERADF